MSWTFSQENMTTLGELVVDVTVNISIPNLS